MVKQENEQNEYNPKKDVDLQTFILACKVIVLITCLILLYSSVSAMILLVRGDTIDHTYTFQDINNYDSNNITWDDTFNVRNITELTDIYEGTYSFTNENLSNTGTQISFVDNIPYLQDDSSVSLSQNISNHDMVLNLTENSYGDTNATVLVSMTDDFLGQWTESGGGYTENWEVCTDDPDIEYMYVVDGDENSLSRQEAETFQDGMKFALSVDILIRANATSALTITLDYTGTGIGSMGFTPIVLSTTLTDYVITWYFPVQQSGFDFTNNDVLIYAPSSLAPTDEVRVYDIKVNATYIGIPTIEIENNFNATFGTYEFWINTNNASVASEIWFENNGTDIFGVRINDSNFQYWNDLFPQWDDIGVIATNNIWYHVRIDFRCGSQTYEGLAQYDFKVFINDTEYGDYDFYYNEPIITDLSFRLYYNNNISYSTYFDAIGYYTFGFYDATYDFENDLYGNPSNWIVDEGGGSIEVIPYTPLHRSVVEINDTSSGDNCFMYQELSETWITNGSIQFYWYSDNVNQTSTFRLSGNLIPSYMLYLFIRDGKFQYFNGGYQDLGHTPLVNNTPYHITINFECTNSDNFTPYGFTNNLSQYTYNVRINNFYNYGDFPFVNNVSYLSEIYYLSDVSHDNYLQYIDAIGYSWDANYNNNDNFALGYTDYSVKDNIRFIYDTTNNLQIDKWEFGYNENGQVTTPSQTSIPFWDEPFSQNPYISTGGIDTRSVQLLAGSTTNETIAHNFTETTGDRIITFGNIFYTHSATGSETHYYDFNVYSFDDTLITRIRLSGDNTLDLSYYNGTDYVVLTSDYSNSFPLTITWTLTLDYYGDYMLFNDNQILKANTTTEGLGRIEIDAWCSGSDSSVSILQIDSVGAYIDGLSITDDYGQYILQNISWNTDLQAPNLSFVNGIGNFSISVVNIYDVGITFVPFTDMNGINRFEYGIINLGNYTNFRIVFLTSDVNFSVSSFNTFQFWLLDSGVRRFPTLSYSSTTFNDSYCWIDDNDYLQFYHEHNDDNTEYLEISFDITNIDTEERSCRYATDENGLGDAYLIIDYTDATATVINFPSHPTETQNLIPQNKVVDNFDILITDSDLLNTGETTGNIQFITLTYYPGVSTPLLILTLIEMLIPLIVILAPTLAIEKKFGKETVIPMLIIMTIICYLTDLIPIWLFFIAIIGLIATLFLKRKVDIKI